MCRRVPAGIFLVLALSVAAVSPAGTENGAGVSWLSPQQCDFGLISRGEPVGGSFVFQNTGTVPLSIDNVRTPCGCTAAEWPETPVAPGDTASIEVEFNAAQSGYFYKEIKVFFRGIRGAHRLVVKGEVE